MASAPSPNKKKHTYSALHTLREKTETEGSENQILWRTLGPLKEEVAEGSKQSYNQVF
jgi:hypothetical protein